MGAPRRPEHTGATMHRGWVLRQMMSDDDRRVLLDAREGRGLASTILIANQLLDHEDLDEAQRDRILQSLARAATTLAHHVVAADEVTAASTET